MAACRVSAGATHIHGRVKGQDGQAIPHVRVILTTGHGIRQAETDGEGQFRLTSFTDGPVRLVLMKDGYAACQTWFHLDPDSIYQFEDVLQRVSGENWPTYSLRIRKQDSATQGLILRISKRDEMQLR